MAKKKKTKRKVGVRSLRSYYSGSYNAPSYQGKHFNLRKIFDDLNKNYFNNKLSDFEITWGRKRKEPPKDYFIFASIQEEDKIIRINPRLDRSFVPRWFLKYIIHHEMLHAVVPHTDINANRRCVHTEEFNEKERAFRLYKRGYNWETKNLERFFQS